MARHRFLLCLLAAAAVATLVAGASVDGHDGLPSRHHRRQRALAVDSTPAACGAWGACSTTCGPGTRSRTCNGEQETQPCQIAPCGQWGPWGQYNRCSKTCGKGTQRRSRMCSTYYGCPGGPTASFEVQDCNEGTCATVGPWGDWGPCSVFCGVGTQNRTRQCLAYGACQGADMSESKECKRAPCCSKWTEWSSCSVTCGVGGQDGVETRSQRCMIAMDGAPDGYATEQRKETRPCGDYLSPCASWNDWQDWGSCSKTCGGGEQTRSRTCSIDGLCSDKKKFGKDTDTRRCHTETCPTWSTEWSSWTLCTVTCGGGTKRRSRQCEVAAQCDGDEEEEKPCNGFPCPEWTSWGRWSFCSEPCGGGYRKRGRVCNQYNLCSGDNKEKEICNEHVCPELGQWSDWGICSDECGGGTQSRSRPCLVASDYCIGDKLEESTCQCDGSRTEGQACMTHACASWGAWGGWGNCNADCGGGNRTRTRPCESDATFCVGDNKNHPSCLCSEGSDNQEGSCNTHVCPNWSTWGSWMECSLTCGGGVKERKRECIKDEDYCSSAPADDATCNCPGLDHSNDVCNEQLCSSYGAWGKWTSCSEPCGGGEKTRKRRCRTDPDFCTDANKDDPACTCSDGDAEATAPCNEHYCAAYKAWGAWGDCSKECDTGTKTRTRECDADATFCFGENADDESCKCKDDGASSEDLSECNIFVCPSFKEWQEWSQCSVTCGGGQRNRKRECERDDIYCQGDSLQTSACQCDGEDVESEPCDAGVCFAWASWQTWSDCTTVCGGGSRNRSRTCPQEGACPGLNSESSICNQTPCPDWGEWGGWSSCSVTCGGGQQARTRACPLEGGCSPGEAYEAQSCNDETCPKWAQWGDWSSCTATCGPGQRSRTRPCEGGTACFGRGSEEEECFAEPCTLTTLWSEWSPCTQTCGGGTQTRSRVESPAPGAATERETQECEAQTCPSWADWQNWSSCSKTCGGGSRTRSRTCNDPGGAEVVNGCVGQAQEIDANPCNAQACTTFFFF